MYQNEDDTFLNRCAGHAERLRQRQNSDRQLQFHLVCAKLLLSLNIKKLLSI